MTADRSRAYGRVMKTLADVGPAKLQPRERELVREAADALLFSGDFERDAHARMAFDALQEMIETLVESERWMFQTADRLLRDVEDCGPDLPAELLAPELLAA
jgi:hypothetical protein